MFELYCMITGTATLAELDRESAISTLVERETITESARVKIRKSNRLATCARRMLWVTIVCVLCIMLVQCVLTTKGEGDSFYKVFNIIDSAFFAVAGCCCIVSLILLTVKI